MPLDGLTTGMRSASRWVKRIFLLQGYELAQVEDTEGVDGGV